MALQTNLQSEFATPPRRGRRKKSKPDIYLLFLLCLHLCCPQSYNQALKSPEVDKWKESIATEIHTLQNQRKCWEVLPYPQGGQQNFLRCYFVFKVNMKNGVVDKYKSMLVVDGSRQVHGIDYTESFAPVVKYITLRIFLAIAAVHDMYVHQLDVESAFIYAPLRHYVKLYICIHTLKCVYHVVIV